MNQRTKILALLGGLFVTTVILVFINRTSIAKYYYMTQFFKNSPAKLFKPHEQEFMKDREALAKYDLFYPSQGKNDAGPYLNPMVHWEIGEVHHQGSLVLPEFIHRELSKDWVVKKPLFKKMGLKFDWMKKLLTYDYWSPEVESPAYPPGKKYETYSFPIPTYKDLVTWAKLRYLYGKETGDTQSALKEVRHLMRLIWTNDFLVSSMVVVNMLKVENQFEEILTPKEIGDWKFIPLDDVMRAKRHFYSLPSMLDIRMSDEYFDKASNTNTGLCHMITEGMMSYIGLREFLSEELKYGFKRMDNLVHHSPCRRTILHKIWDDPTMEVHNTLHGVTVLNKPVSMDDLKKDPALSASVGYILGAVAGPMYFQYGKDEK